MLTMLLILPSLGAAGSGIRVMGPSKVHSVSDVAGASSGWNIAVDHMPPPIGRFLFFVDSSRKRAFISSSFCGIRGGEVVGLAPILVDVVEFPPVRQRRPFLDAFRHPAHPRLARAKGAGEPTVVIDAAAGHDVEELRFPPVPVPWHRRTCRPC